MSEEIDQEKQAELERELIMDSLEELFIEHESNVKNNIIKNIVVHLKGDDSESDRALQLSIRIIRGVEDEQE